MQSKGARPPSLSGGNSFGSGNPPFANLSASYQTLLSSLAISNARFTLTMSALTVGHVYQFEWWRMETDLVVVVILEPLDFRLFPKPAKPSAITSGC